MRKDALFSWIANLAYPARYNHLFCLAFPKCSQFITSFVFSIALRRLACYNLVEVMTVKLNDYMKLNSLTAQALSDASGISKRTIEQYTSGRRIIANAKAVL